MGFRIKEFGKPHSFSLIAFWRNVHVIPPINNRS